MTDNPFEIPEFLRRRPGDTSARTHQPLVKKPLEATKKKKAWNLPATIDATGLAILRQQEREASERKRARLAALKERRP